MERYRYMLVDRPPLYENQVPDEVYLEKMKEILSAFPCIGVPSEPSNIMGNVYLGSSANAENIPLLKSIGINYILNCAGGHILGLHRQRSKYPPETGVRGYEEIPLEEWDDADLTSYLDRAHGYLDQVRGRGGKVLIHCPGVSRSGAVALSYMCRSGMTLLQATKVLKDKRRCVLTHEGFMLQIVRYCRDRGMLEKDVDTVSAPRYMRKLDMYRINSAHLPMFL